MREWLSRATAVFVGSFLALILSGYVGWQVIEHQVSGAVDEFNEQLGSVTQFDEPILPEPDMTYDPDLEPEPESWPTEP